MLLLPLNYTWQQKYANYLALNDIINRDAINLIFPGLKPLLEFQQRFLIKLEICADLPSNKQRWGLYFIEHVRH